MHLLKKYLLILFLFFFIESWSYPLTDESSCEIAKEYIITKIDSLKNNVYVIYARSGNDEFKIVSSLDSVNAVSETIKVGNQYKLLLESLYLAVANKASDAGWVGYEEHVKGMGIKGNTIPVDSYYGSKRDIYKSPNLNGLYYIPNITLSTDESSEYNFFQNSSIMRKGDVTIYCGEEWFKSYNSKTISGKFQLKNIFWFHKGKDYYYTDFSVEKDGVNYLVIDTIQSHYPYYFELLSKGDENIKINMEISEIWPLNDTLMNCGIFPANKDSFTMRDVLFVEEKYGNKIYMVQTIDFK